ncbi:FtsX-like permease family protein [Hamadaea sp. NPDC050747]|uniref:FtsX-like permease family protein n=1 Tax=Hamadaea sp. NPDC050747 TaxID=3155789 RepID=UPI0033DC48A4
MIAWSTVRGRISGFAGTFAALALGVTLLATSLLVYASAAPRTPERFAAAPMVVHAPIAGNDDGVVKAMRPWSVAETDKLRADLAAQPGVTQVVVDRGFYAQAVVDGRPLAATDGHNWSSALLGAYQLIDGSAPDADGELAVDAELGLRPGTRVPVLTGRGPVEMTVVGTVSGPGYYVSDEQATRLAPGVVALGVWGSSTVDIERVVGERGAVVTGDARKVLEPEHDARIRWLGTQLLVAMATLGGFVTVFVVAGTFALQAAHRRRELALLRLVGATPGQIRRLIAGEALLIGVTAAATGALLSTVAAPLLGRFLVRSGLENPDLVVRPTAGPILVAVVVGVVVGLAGSWSAARRSARVRPMEALLDAAVESRAMTPLRWISAGAATVLTGVMAVLTASADASHRVDNALFTAMAAIVAATAWAPVILGPLARLVTWPLLRLQGATGMLVRGEIQTATRRTAATAAPIIATVGLAVLLSSMVATMREAYPQGKARELNGISVALPDETPGLTDAAVRASGGTGDLTTRVFADSSVFDAVGRASFKATGSRLVTFADGVSQTVPVAQSGTDLVLPRDVVRAHDPSALTEYAMGASASSASSLARSGSKVVDAQTYAEGEYAEDMRLLWLFALVLIGLSVGYTGIAVATTMAMSAQARRADRLVLARSGAGQGQIRRTVITETTFVVGVGALLGLGVVVPALAGMAHGLTEETQTAVSLHLHWATVGWVTGACLLLAVASALVSARRRT